MRRIGILQDFAEADPEGRVQIAALREELKRGCPAFLLNIEKRSLPRLMLSGDGLASNDAV
jgi:hypothetical protein